ncbi:MAG: hypothetical protein ACRCZO_01730 [Cetobacterium sp.]
MIKAKKAKEKEIRKNLRDESIKKEEKLKKMEEKCKGAIIRS